MSATDGQPAELRAFIDALPEFELDYAVDDRQEPTEVTIYDPFATDLTTHWLTADARCVVDLAEVA